MTGTEQGQRRWRLITGSDAETEYHFVDGDEPYHDEVVLQHLNALESRAAAWEALADEAFTTMSNEGDDDWLARYAALKAEGESR